MASVDEFQTVCKLSEIIQKILPAWLKMQFSRFEASEILYPSKGS